MRIQEEGYKGVVAIVVGTDGIPKRGVQVVCTVAGNVNFNMADGSDNIVPVAVGLTVLPYAVLGVNTASTTATATYAHLV